jgi:hypothetical protein
MRDIKNYGAVADGATDISAICNAQLLIDDIIIQNGEFVIGGAILIPSDRTVYLKNCKVRLLDAIYDNIFRNSDYVNGNSNINIIGLGNAVLDGNSVGNGNDDYATYPLGTAGVHRYNGIFLCNVTGFVISDVFFSDSSHYHITLQRAINGLVHDIYFTQKTTTRNQDGISIIFGCHDIEIYNISGYTKDDFINMHIGPVTANLQAIDIPDAGVGDVYNIDIHDIDIYNSALGSLYAAIVANGNKEYNISYKDCVLRKVGSVYYNYIGYGTPASSEFWHDITMDNIVVGANARAELYFFNSDMRDFVSTNITNNTLKELYTIGDCDVSDNVTINGVQVE